MSVQTVIESLLFVSHKPLTAAQFKRITNAKKTELDLALEKLLREYAPEQKKGVMLAHSDGAYQLVTHPDNEKIIAEFLKMDETGELTEPSLETLTIIAYRGPMTKPEIEQIRGVNCSIILRNLLIRGLIEKTADKKLGTDVYRVTIDFLRFLGAQSVADLPDYQTLHAHETLDAVLREGEESESPESV